MHTTTIELEGHKLFFRSVGAGPCVVLLHGFGEDGNVWQRQWEHLQGYRLLIPDLPGTGISEAVPDMSMEGLARVVQQLLKHEKIDSCVLIGHSMGGYIALAFLELFPEAVLALGLFHSTSYADTEEKKETRRKGVSFVEKNGGAVFLQTTIPNLYAPITRDERPELVQAHFESVKHTAGATLVAYYGAMMERPDRSGLLQQNKIPYLFVLGKYDTAVPFADGLSQVHLPLLAYVHLLQRSGHMGMVEEPEQSNKLLQAFLTAACRT